VHVRGWTLYPTRRVPKLGPGARFASTAIFVSSLLFSARALAAAQVVGASMTGAQETPANASPATGTCSASIDPSLLQVTFSGTFSGLAAQASGATLRGLAGRGSVGPGLLTATTLTAGVSGSLSGGGTLTSEQAAGMLAGQTYCEIDDATFPSGEIRGQLILPPAAPAVTPCGVAWLALIVGCAGVVSRGVARRRVDVTQSATHLGRAA
jgi:CHRD domain